MWEVVVCRSITNIFMYALWFLFFEQTLSPKHPRKTQIILFLVLTAVPSVLFGFTELLGNGFRTFRMLSGLGCVFLFVLAAYCNTVSRKIFVFIVQFLIVALGEAFGLIVTTLLEGGYSIQTTPMLTFTVAVSIDIIVQATLFFCVHLFFKRRGNYLSLNKLAKFALYPAAQLVMFTCVAWILMGNNTLSIVVSILSSVLAAAAADAVLLFTIQDIAKKKELELKNLYLEEQKSIQMRHYAALQKQYSDIRKLKHDIVSHLHTVTILTERGENEKAKEYAHSLQKQYSEISSTSYCENCVVDAILMDKLQIAKQNTIQVKVDVNIPEQLNITDTNLICIFSNLLDNALEACSMVEDESQRKISILSLIRLGNFTIIIENTCCNQLKIKSDSGHHYGIGQTIIENIVKLYGGSFLTQKHNGNYLVKIAIPAK